MKKLLQMILVLAMIVSCVCMVSCFDGGASDGVTSGDSVTSGSATTDSGATSDGEASDSTCQHEYTESVIAATCVNGGYTEHVCKKCGDEYKDNETPAFGHDMVWTVTSEATCTESGLKNGACERCDYTETDVEIPKLGHHYVEVADDQSAKAATCTEDGLKVEICDREGCGDRREVVLMAFGHTDDGTKAEVTAPTCTEQGYTTRHCSVCGEDYREDYVNAVGHDLKLAESVAVSCLTDGYELWACDREGCDYSERRNEQDKIDHVFNDKGECQSGCGKTLSDKITWANTKYSVTYNEAADRLTMDGGDPGKTEIQRTVTIPAELFVKMKNEGKVQFAVTVYKRNGTTPIFGFNFTGELADWKYGENNADSHTTGIMEITDEMLTGGFEFFVLYADLTQRDPAWKATEKCTGFDMDIEFIKPFDINDRSMWLTSGFASMTYSAEKGKWVAVDGNPGTAEIQKNVTIKADVFNAMKDGYGSFVVKITAKDDGTSPIFGMKEVYEGGSGYKYGNIAYTSEEKTITDEMLTNGYSFTVLYADRNQRNNVEATVVNGFEMDIEFIKLFDINDKSMWLTSGFANMNYSAEKGMWVVNDANPGADSIKHSVTIKADVFKAMTDATSFRLYMYNQGATTQKPQFGIHDGTKWTYAHAQDKPLVVTIAITDDMRANGFTFTALYLDNEQKQPGEWGGTEVVTGFDMDIEFISTITLNASGKTYVKDGKAFYDGTITSFNVASATDNGAGGTYFMIGSYGVYFRGGAFRLAICENGAFKEFAPRVQVAELANSKFNAGIKLGLSVTVKDDSTITLSVYVDDELKGTADVARVSDEIASGEATATVEITGYVTELVLIK